MASAVLVVDDDPDLRELVVETLEDAGYPARGTSSDQALACLGKGRFELVIADVRLATRRQGVSPIGALKQLQPHLRCILIAPFQDEETLEQGLAFQVDFFIFRPLRMPELLEAVRKLTSGQDRKSSRGFLDRVLALPARLLQRSPKARKSALESERTLCLELLHEALQEDVLTPSAAMEAWDKLAHLEERFHRLEGPLSAEGQKLVHPYQELSQLIQAMAEGRTECSFRSRSPGQVDRASFQRFCERIRGGRVLPEHMGSAWLAWSSGSGAPPELRNLRKLLWEAPPARSAPKPTQQVWDLSSPATPGPAPPTPVVAPLAEAGPPARPATPPRPAAPPRPAPPPLVSLPLRGRLKPPPQGSLAPPPLDLETPGQTREFLAAPPPLEPPPAP